MKKKKENLQVKLNQVVRETSGEFIVIGCCDGQPHKLLLVSIRHIITLFYNNSKNILAFRKTKPWPSLLGVNQGSKCDLTVFFFYPHEGGGVKRELWVMEDLSENLKKTVDYDMSLLPKTPSSGKENMAASEVKLSDSKKKKNNKKKIMNLHAC